MDCFFFPFFRLGAARGAFGACVAFLGALMGFSGAGVLTVLMVCCGGSKDMPFMQMEGIGEVKKDCRPSRLYLSETYENIPDCYPEFLAKQNLLIS